jgi:hypothetical protein
MLLFKPVKWFGFRKAIRLIAARIFQTRCLHCHQPIRGTVHRPSVPVHVSTESRACAYPDYSGTLATWR